MTNNDFNYKYNKLFIAGLPKSGTTRIENFLYNIPGYIAKPLHGNMDIINNHDLPIEAFSQFDADRYTYVKTHVAPTKENIKILHDNNINKIVITYRDLKDVALSRYFHHLYKKTRYTDVSQEEGILDSLKVINEEYVWWINGWLEYTKAHKEDTFIMRYEDVVQEPVEKFYELCNFYELNLSKESVKSILDKVDSDMKDKGFKTNEKVGEKSTFRKGIIGDWKNYFTNKHLEYIESEMKEPLERFGYSL